MNPKESPSPSPIPTPGSQFVDYRQNREQQNLSVKEVVTQTPSATTNPPASSPVTSSSTSGTPTSVPSKRMPLVATSHSKIWRIFAIAIIIIVVVVGGAYAAFAIAFSPDRTIPASIAGINSVSKIH
jgi:hypothetical protein